MLIEHLRSDTPTRPSLSRSAASGWRQGSGGRHAPSIWENPRRGGDDNGTEGAKDKSRVGLTDCDAGGQINACSTALLELQVCQNIAVGPAGVSHVVI